MKNIQAFFVFLFLAAVTSAFAGPPTIEAQPAPTPAEENHLNMFDYEMDYTFKSNFYDVHGDFGNGSSLYNDFSYSHRFLVTGKWYFRAGVEYERFDFGAPIMVCPIISKPRTLYWRLNMWCTIMRARVSRLIQESISKITPTMRSIYQPRRSSRFR